MYDSSIIEEIVEKSRNNLEFMLRKGPLLSEKRARKNMTENSTTGISKQLEALPGMPKK
ncbi:MAG: hypothetical protein QW597_01295 [Thermoplasmataceae archaeon]